MSKKAKLRLGLVAVFVIGVFLAAAPWTLWLGSLQPATAKEIESLFDKVGDALMIAPILAIIVEIAVAQDLIEEFVYRVSHHIVGRMLPPALQEHMLKYLTTDFIRTRYAIEYHLEVLSDHNGFVQLRRVIDYDLQNRSTSDRDFPFRYEVQRSWFPRIGETEFGSGAYICG